MPTTLDAYPVALCLEDGRTLFVELPARLVRHDRDGTVGYTTEGIRRLDQLRALATQMGPRPTPGHIAALRGALGFTQKQFSEKIGVDKLTVSEYRRRWTAWQVECRADWRLQVVTRISRKVATIWKCPNTSYWSAIVRPTAVT